MITPTSRFFTRFVAGPVAAASILGGVAFGLAAGANAATNPMEQMQQQRVAEAQHQMQAERRAEVPSSWIVAHPRAQPPQHRPMSPTTRQEQRLQRPQR